MNPSDCRALLETGVVIASVTPEEHRRLGGIYTHTKTCIAGCSGRMSRGCQAWDGAVQRDRDRTPADVAVIVHQLSARHLEPATFGIPSAIRLGAAPNETGPAAGTPRDSRLASALRHNVDQRDLPDGKRGNVLLLAMERDLTPTMLQLAGRRK